MPAARFLLACLLLGAVALPLRAESSYNYVELLQHGLYFYECQEAGRLSPGNRVVWRGPSCLDDGEEVGLDLSGGWYDAGDHWKANSTMALGASYLAWSVITFPDIYQDNGQLPHALNSLRHICDYFRRCVVDPQPDDPDDFNGYEVYIDVGGKTTPASPFPRVHSVWCSPEVIDGYTIREPTKVNADLPNGGVSAAMAATLASAAQVFHLYGTAADRALAAELWPIAVKLSDFARAHPASSGRAYRPNGESVAVGYADTWGHDDILWSRIWLHRGAKAMGLAGYDGSFLEDARAIWDELDTAGTLFNMTAWWREYNYNHASMLAWLQTDHTAAEEERMVQPLARLFELWYEANPDASPDTSKFYHTPYGLKFRQVYGSAFVGHRVFANASLAAMYAHWLESGADKDRYTGFVRSQVDYYLGDNKQEMSYVVGFGDQGWPDTNHHRGAHGPWASHDHRIDGKALHMPWMRHVIYGGLIGGPDSNDDFTDGTFDVPTTEPIIGAAGKVQIVAAFLASLDPEAYAADPTFPPAPDRDLSLDPEWTDHEIYVAARIDSFSDDTLTLATTLYNRSSWPARVLHDASFRYYFTADGGESGDDDFELTVDSAQGGEAGEIVHVADDLFYAEVTFPGERLLPDRRNGVELWRRDASLTIRAKGGSFAFVDDWSAQALDESRQVVLAMPVYQAGVLVAGEEPEAGDGPVRQIGLQVTPVSRASGLGLLTDPLLPVDNPSTGVYATETTPEQTVLLQLLPLDDI